MIILYEENETQFQSAGLGILKDALTANVTESLNDSFELEITYPITGALYNELRIDRIIYCKTNPYDEAQAFRIYSITQPLNGTVTVSANHISYDMNGIPVTALSGDNLNDILNKIQNGWDETIDDKIVHKKCAILENQFNFNTDIFSAKTFKTTSPYNLRALLMGGDESIVSRYDAELKFDNFKVSLLQHRGYDRGAKVIYGHNMTDLNHKIMSDNLYNGVFPYYHTEKTSTETQTNDEFKQVYIVGTKLFQSDWLSYTENGSPFIPVAEAPVQIATEGEYEEKIFMWNEIYQRYEEKIYNEQVNLIQGVFEPTWISIDWSKILEGKVTCKANKVGYFKTMTDTDWGDIKGVGDIVFEGSIFDSGIMQNIVLCYSEVIPSNQNSESEEVSEIIDVQLDDPIIWIKNKPDTRNMLHNRILNLDLTSEFDEAPTQDQLRTRAEQYINENKIGVVKHNTTVSFIDLASTTEADKYQNFDHIELGDAVEVIYRDLNVDVSLRVISTDYDVISDRYNEIELGEKEEELSTKSIQTGSNISSLTNDAGYADVTTVNKLIAQTVTAEYLQAVNAKLSNAQIKQLEVERINATGIIEAAQFNLDTLVAKLLTADDAVIKKTLKAGEIEVSGDITIKSGEISIESENGDTSFHVDREGNMSANSVNITGGNLDIGDGNFIVDINGNMSAMNATIVGNIESQTGKIAAFYIRGTTITTDEDFDSDEPVYNDEEIYITPEIIKAGEGFSVTDDGTITTKKGRIGPLKIEEETSRNSNDDLILTYRGTNDEVLFKIDPSVYGDPDPDSPESSVYCLSIIADMYISPGYSENWSYFTITEEGLHAVSRNSYGDTYASDIPLHYIKNIPVALTNSSEDILYSGRTANLYHCKKIICITTEIDDESLDRTAYKQLNLTQFMNTDDTILSVVGQVIYKYEPGETNKWPSYHSAVLCTFDNDSKKVYWHIERNNVAQSKLDKVSFIILLG